MHAMAYLVITECRIDQTRMQEFTAQVQKWEQDALKDDDAPNWHAVYLAADDPTRVVIVTQFESRDKAGRFEAKGRHVAFATGVLRCVTDEPRLQGYDLFYAATPSGPTVTFGQETWRR